MLGKYRLLTKMAVSFQNNIPSTSTEAEKNVTVNLSYISNFYVSFKGAQRLRPQHRTWSRNHGFTENTIVLNLFPWVV